MIDLQVVDNVGIVKFERPPANAFNEEAKEELAKLFNEISERNDIYCVIFRTAGKGFSGGNDLGEIAEYRKNNPGGGAKSARTTDLLCEAIYNCKKPVIAAVHGYVAGLGLAVVSVCDLIVASEDARFLLPEVKIGHVGGPFFVRRLLPDKIARYYIYTGLPIYAADMKSYGAVLRVVSKEHLYDEAMRVAKDICQNYPKAVWLYKQSILEGEKEEQDIIYVSSRARKWAGHLKGDPNRDELLAAQREHRKPVYNFDDDKK